MKENKKKVSTYVDTQRVEQFTKMAKRVASYLNNTVVPLCRDCGVGINEEIITNVIRGDYSEIRSAYMERGIASVDNEFLVPTVKKACAEGFEEIRKKYQSEPPKNLSYYSSGGMETIKPSDATPFIRIQQGVFVVDADAIMRENSFDVELSEEYQKVQAICAAFNELPNPLVAFMPEILFNMIKADKGKLYANPLFDYNILNK